MKNLIVVFAVEAVRSPTSPISTVTLTVTVCTVRLLYGGHALPALPALSAGPPQPPCLQRGLLDGRLRQSPPRERKDLMSLQERRERLTWVMFRT